MILCILKVNFEHIDDCSWQHGGMCDCQPEMLAARKARHCEECDFLWSYSGETPCNCKSACLYPDDLLHAAECPI